MGDTAEVVIVGGGAAGCAAAYYLAKAGVKATIIEREGVGSQASGYSAGGLNPLQGAGIPGPLGSLAKESFRMHLGMWDQLKGEADVDFQSRVVSNVTVAFGENELSAMDETLKVFEKAEGFSTHWLGSDELHEVEPRLAHGIIQGLYTYGNAALDSYLFTVALSKAAQMYGASIRLGKMIGLKKSGGRATGIVLEDGEMACDQLVLAMGPWSVGAERWLGAAIPVDPLKGEMLRMELTGQKPLAHSFSWGQVFLFPRAGGLVWVGATQERHGFDTQPSESARRSLLKGAVKLMPAMADTRLVKHTACLRPVTPDWLPIVGKAPGWDNVYLATGGAMKGILISPGMGKAIADLITEGHTPLSIGPFAPERFAGAS